MSEYWYVIPAKLAIKSAGFDVDEEEIEEHLTVLLEKRQRPATPNLPKRINGRRRGKNGA